MTDDIVVGIDLGTTHSLVAMVHEGDVRRFADDRGEELLPSAVAAAADGSLVVGRQARNRRLLDPERTVMSVKRSMGRDIKLSVGPHRLSPPQISALILGALLDQAQAALGARPGAAIITVPAYFDEAQRQATKDAGEIAGLRVERLVNEPTAAAMAQASGAEELVMIYDFGGGTFDVSILERDGDVLEVTASHGDTALGGDDIDRALYDWVIRELGGTGALVDRDPRAKTQLLEAVERAKMALSERQEVRLFDPLISSQGRGVNLDMPLARAALSTIARPFVERTLRSIDRALFDAKVSAHDLDRVVLVGGSSRLAVVAEMVQNHLDMPAQLERDADRAVVNGAARLAGRAMGADVAEVLIDITPHTLSAGAVQHGSVELHATPMIARGTVVPAERRHTFFTMLENQKEVSAPICQGERELVDDNIELGEVVIAGLPPSPAFSPVDVTFRLDLSGVLDVEATHLPSGLSAEVRIANSPYRLTSREREQARQQIEALRAVAPPSEATALDTDLALAKAMAQRADRALAQRATPELEAGRVRADAARRTLVDAIERRSTEVVALTEALSDALLDLL
jgi:molecular chaperone DnaK